MIEVAVIAPNRFYREGLALILRNIGGFHVIAAVSRPEEIAPLSAVRGVILFDVVDSGDGLGAVGSLAARNPGCRSSCWACPRTKSTSSRMPRWAPPVT